SLREYRGVSILTPILVSLEVVMECIMPFITARLVNEIKAGCSIDEILRIGGLLVLMAALSLLFGSLAGLICSTASCGLGTNLRHRSEEHTSELQSRFDLVCRLLLETKKSRD